MPCVQVRRRLGVGGRAAAPSVHACMHACAPVHMPARATQTPPPSLACPAPKWAVPVVPCIGGGAAYLRVLSGWGPCVPPVRALRRQGHRRGRAGAPHVWQPVGRAAAAVVRLCRQRGPGGWAAPGGQAVYISPHASVPDRFSCLHDIIHTAYLVSIHVFLRSRGRGAGARRRPVCRVSRAEGCSCLPVCRSSSRGRSRSRLAAASRGSAAARAQQRRGAAASVRRAGDTPTRTTQRWCRGLWFYRYV